MMSFETPEIYQGHVDPDAGFLSLLTCWRPTAGAGSSDITGEKLSMASFIPCAPDEPCLCGSGKLFGECCQPKPLWHPICPNPGLPEGVGYSHVRMQSATFTHIDGAAVRERLMDDIRLRCSKDTPRRGFWIYEGDPAIQTPEGIMCFGDIELSYQRTLLVTAMSDLRMQTLLELLDEDCGDLLGRPKMKYNPASTIDKRSRRSHKPARRAAKRRRRRRL